MSSEPNNNNAENNDNEEKLKAQLEQLKTSGILGTWESTRGENEANYAIQLGLSRWKAWAAGSLSASNTIKIIEGDKIEISGKTHVFGIGREKKLSYALGESVKTTVEPEFGGGDATTTPTWDSENSALITTTFMELKQKSMTTKRTITDEDPNLMLMEREYDGVAMKKWFTRKQEGEN